uniref:Integrase catalytic domain-containing protein n=1 Tax=Tanacetum cinerariifolium TaxID=118510 RepID=A0A699HTF3_TANCI|nr:hypothetical protein [Tanacetum cinerariifolium]
MRCLLIQHGWEAALDPFSGTMTDADKTATLNMDIYKKVHSALLLCLDNKVLREVNKEDSVAGVWLKLKTLYMIKSLANKLYLKNKLFTFYRHSGKKLSEHIDEFNKLIGDLTNIDVDIDNVNQALMLLTSLPHSYDNFVEALLYGREPLNLEDVLSSLNSRELKKRTGAKDDGDGLYVKGRSDHQGNQRRIVRNRSRKKSTGFVKKNVRQGYGMHSEGYNNGDLLMAMSEERFLEWIMDFGGSFHMTPRRDFLYDFKEFNGGAVLLDDNRACAIMGIGKGEASVGIQEKESLAQVWHKRLGHISEVGLHEVEKVEVLGNKGLDKLELCKNCVLGKSTKGPSRVESMSGCRYFLSIVDDYSRRVWVHFLRHKNEVFSKFKKWKQLVENQTGRKLKKLRTDNGLEFCNQEFNNLCKESEIARHLTVAGTPQQNGLAERMNRTLLNKVRCLLIQTGLPDSFWAEATVTAAYLINRSPSTALEKMTPMDLWSGHPANYEMLRIHGCVAYSHVNQRKLKPRAIKCIFLGYPDGVNGYRLCRLDDVKPKIIISRDVVFNESHMYKDTLKGAGLYILRRKLSLREKRTTSILVRYRDEGNVSLSRPLGSKVDDMAAYAFAIAEEEDTHKPITSQEAINLSNQDKWVRAMEEEMSSLMKNHTWEMVNQPPDYKLEQLDVKTAFLHGNLEETIYMRQPRGFKEGTGNKVCLLKKSLYGLKQSPRQCKSAIEYTKGLLQKEFDMKELGPARKILGIEIVRDRGSRILKVSQSRYVQKILNNYRVDNGKSVNVPLGAHFKVKNHWEAVKWILKYLKGTADLGLVYGRDQGKHVDIDGFVDADYAKDPNKEAEYMALTEAVKESIWLKGLLIELGVNLRSVVVSCDNQSAIHFSRNAMFHERTKHINVRYHFIREIVESKEIKVENIVTKDNAADAFTNVVPGPKFKYCIEILGVGIN